MKILIVDDSAPMRRMMRGCLQGLANEIRECADGGESLAIYTVFKPDWVLMDWEMKQMDGLAATRQILNEYPDARILFVTQYDDDDLRCAADEAGACGYLQKDNLFELRSMLNRDAARSLYEDENL